MGYTQTQSIQCACVVNNSLVGGNDCPTVLLALSATSPSSVQSPLPRSPAGQFSSYI